MSNTPKKLADQSDIEIALEKAQEIEDDGFPTAAGCIRACAETARSKLSDIQELAQLLEDPEAFARNHGFVLQYPDENLQQLCELRFAIGWAKGIVRKWLPEVKS